MLEERVAELLGLEAAVFLPSGTMCHEIALRLHARPGGDEVILDRTAVLDVAARFGLRTRVLAEGVAALPGVQLDVSTVETNIVIFSVADARGLVARLADRVGLQAFDAHQVRAVTHLDVWRADVERAVAAIADELG